MNLGKKNIFLFYQVQSGKRVFFNNCSTCLKNTFSSTQISAKLFKGVKQYVIIVKQQKMRGQRTFNREIVKSRISVRLQSVLDAVLQYNQDCIILSSDLFTKVQPAAFVLKLLRD